MDTHDLSQAAQAPRVPEAALRSPAMCALHADTPAVATCTRCGDSACAACLQVTSESALCRACQQRAMQRRLDLLGAERLVRALGITIIVVSLFWLCLGVIAVVIATTAPQKEGVLVTWAPVLPIGWSLALRSSTSWCCRTKHSRLRRTRFPTRTGSTSRNSQARLRWSLTLDGHSTWPACRVDQLHGYGLHVSSSP
jgi:hypothetical protein